eukprot:1157837-Pelagomonas_calceolata.AAC.9
MGCKHHALFMKADAGIAERKELYAEQRQRELREDLIPGLLDAVVGALEAHRQREIAQGACNSCLAQVGRYAAAATGAHAKIVQGACNGCLAQMVATTAKPVVGEGCAMKASSSLDLLRVHSGGASCSKHLHRFSVRRVETTLLAGCTLPHNGEVQLLRQGGADWSQTGTLCCCCCCCCACFVWDSALSCLGRQVRRGMFCMTCTSNGWHV